MPNIDTSKVKTIAGEMIDINNRYRDNFSAVEQAINRLRTDWQQPHKVSAAAFACFDEIKAKFFEPSITERRELAQFLCDAVGIGYEEAEKTNKNLLEQLFDVSRAVSSVLSHVYANNTTDSQIITNDLVQKMDQAGTIQNNSTKKDENYISKGCVITAITNLYRRQQVYVGQNVTITKSKIYDLNGGPSLSSSVLNPKVQKEYGFSHTIKYGPLNNKPISVNEIDDLLKQHPSGVVVFAKGETTDHAVLITQGSNGEYFFVDPIDGGQPRKWEDTTSYNLKGEKAIFDGWSIDDLIKNTWWVAYV